jgi:hypothetical protein
MENHYLHFLQYPEGTTITIIAGSAMTTQNPDHDRQAEQPAAGEPAPDQPAVEQDPPYLVELIDAVIAAYPSLTRDEAQERLLASGA